MEKMEKSSQELNVIIADSDWQTFEILSELGKQFNFINLSSDFAVNFILDYEKVDVVILSKKIPGHDAILKKARKRKANLYILGKDLKYPVDVEQIKGVLEEEKAAKNKVYKSRQDRGLRKYFKKFLMPDTGIDENDDYWDRVAGKNSVQHEESTPGDDLIETEKIFYGKDLDGSERRVHGGDLDEPGRTVYNKDLIKPERSDYDETLFKPSEKVSGKDIFENKDNEKDFTEDGLYGSGSDLPESKPGLKDLDYLKNYSFLESGKGSEEDFWGNDKMESEYTAGTERQDRNLFQNKGYKNLSENIALKNTVALKQKIIVFIKAKGGVGSTLLSLFLGYEFRKLKTLLVDLNFSEGGSDLGYYLNIPKVPNIIIFTEGYNRAAMDNSVINIKDSFDIIQSPPSYELSKKLDLQDIYSLVDIAKKKYHLIIFDLPNLINDIYLGVLDMADLVLMISDFTLGSVGRLASINNRFIYNDLEKILVMNRARNGNGFKFTGRQLKEFFNLDELIILNEDEILSGRTDFTDLKFSNLKDFSSLTTKVLELLTCD